MKKRGKKESFRDVFSKTNTTLMIILIFVSTILILQEVSKLKEEAGLEGELKSLLGTLGQDEETGVYLPEDCSELDLYSLWDSVFEGAPGELRLVVNETETGFCAQYLVYIVSEGNIVKMLFGRTSETSENTNYNIVEVYANLTTGAIITLNEVNEIALNEFITGYPLILATGVGVAGERNIPGISEANEEFNRIFDVTNGSWVARTDIVMPYYYFSNKGEGRIYKDKTLDLFNASFIVKKPINLTKTHNIPNIVLNGSRPHYYVINLSDYFVNVGKGINLSFRYSLSEPGAFIVTRPLMSSQLNFNTFNTFGGNFTMNITLSHPEWNSGQNVTSNNFNVTIYGCLDSDWGNNVSVKGTARNLSENKTDYCVNDTLIEYRCNLQRIESTEINCSINGSCNDGKCIVNVSVNHPPEFLSGCDDIVFNVNTSYILNMKSCFEDDDNDNLVFRYDNMSISNISITRNDTNLTLTPAINFIGNGSFIVYANDSKNETSGRIEVEVRAVPLPPPPCARQSLNVTCVNWTCGTKIDNCNNSVNCGSCITGLSCENGRCVNSTTPPPVRVTGSSPQENNVSVAYGENKPFSITAENYDTIEWYVDGDLVKSGVTSFTPSNLSGGSYEIKALVKKGDQVVSKIWNLNVLEKPKRSYWIYIVIAIIGIVFAALVVVVIFIIRSSMEKEEKPAPIIQERPRQEQIQQSFLPR